MARRKARARPRLGHSKRPLWRCPACGHRFVTRNMWHSCGRVPLSDHFRGKPAAVRAVFDAWRDFVRRFGPFTVLPQQTRICFQTRVRFAGAMIRRDFVWCTFWLRRRVADPPAFFEPVEVLPTGYYIYRFRLSDTAQLRARGLKALLRESYRLGMQRGMPARGSAGYRRGPP